MSGAGEGTGRAVPFHCPYCGDEDLRPHEAGHGAWLCGACRRAFTLKFLGLDLPARAGTTNTANTTTSEEGT